MHLRFFTVNNDISFYMFRYFQINVVPTQVVLNQKALSLNRQEAAAVLTWVFLLGARMHLPWGSDRYVRDKQRLLPQHPFCRARHGLHVCKVPRHRQLLRVLWAQGHRRGEEKLPKEDPGRGAWV